MCSNFLEFYASFLFFFFKFTGTLSFEFSSWFPWKRKEKLWKLKAGSNLDRIIQKLSPKAKEQQEHFDLRIDKIFYFFSDPVSFVIWFPFLFSLSNINLYIFFPFFVKRWRLKLNSTQESGSPAQIFYTQVKRVLFTVLTWYFSPFFFFPVNFYPVNLEEK